MRKAFSLVELLAVLALSMVLAIPLTGMFRIVLGDIPKNLRVAHTANTSQLFIRALEQDVKKAVKLEILNQSESDSSGHNPLVIDTGDYLITYHLIGDRVYRYTRKNKTEAEKDQLFTDISEELDHDKYSDQAWLVENIRLEWSIWQKDKIQQALEVRSAIKYKYQGREILKRKINYVFFMPQSQGILTK